MSKSSEFPQCVSDELVRARAKFPKPESIPDGWSRNQLMHYWSAAIEEEFLELREEVFKQHPRDSSLREELVQLAAMCQRAAESCGLVRR